MKKGFTLIELLAVIAILAIIMLIATPRILDVIGDVRGSALTSDEKMLSKAAETYLASNTNLLPEKNGDIAIVRLSSLKTDEFISEIKTQDGSICDGYVIAKNNNGKYEYNPYIDCETTYTTADYDSEYINEPANLLLDYLIVAGGGAGGYRHGGGGGAGGLIFEEAEMHLIGEVNEVIVGAGGSRTITSAQPESGSNSSFSGQVAIGGGRAAQWDGGYSFPQTGGSGGGSVRTDIANGTAGQGNAGGSSYTSMASPYNHGGGGGAGHVGYNGTADSHGSGGEGLYYGDKFGDIYGDSGWFAGGGGGGGHDPAAINQGLGGIGGGGNGGQPGVYMDGEDGLANTGGGGGGASTPGGGSNYGGAGGSGIVLIRYAGPQKANGGIITEYNGYTVHAFLSGISTFEILDY